MKVIVSPQKVYAQLDFARREGRRIGLIPTMGALHAGHLSLVQRAKEECDVAVTSIFVNPSQFGPNEDFSKYPRTFDSDLQQLERAGCDIVFAPRVEDVYPAGYSTYVEPPAVAQLWEGRCRPSHFRGVTTIVLKLFLMAPANVAYFGRKDYQQVAVLAAMVHDLNVPIRIVACDTVRESDGLAMSSRNRYLSDLDRARALSLYRALGRAREMVEGGQTSVAAIEAEMQRILLDAPVDAVEYAAIVDPDTMEHLDVVRGQAVAILAAKVGSTRLIDNLTLHTQ